MGGRGFGAFADRLAAEIRSELGLGNDDRFDPLVLASAYDIPVVPITELVEAGASESSIHQLTVVDDGCFSAGTLMVNTARFIIFNPAHSKGRLANSLAHELAHLLLEHPAGPAIGPGGCRLWDNEKEEEADTLAGILLVSREAALACARIGLPHQIGAARFGVSSELMRWRTDKSGANKQARAAAKMFGKSIPRLAAPQLRELLAASELTWLGDISAAEWRRVLGACKSALAKGSVVDLITTLNHQPD